MTKGIVTLKVTTIPTDEPDTAHSHTELSAVLNDKARTPPPPLKDCVHELIHDHYEAIEYMIDRQKEFCEMYDLDFKLVQLVSE